VVDLAGSDQAVGAESHDPGTRKVNLMAVFLYQSGASRVMIM
jgi:hypothetical protein